MSIDTTRLEQAITLHRIAQREWGPDAYLGHACMGGCAEDIIREYDELHCTRTVRDSGTRCEVHGDPGKCPEPYTYGEVTA